MYQDLTNGFPEKLGHEALAAQLPPDLIADLYPNRARGAGILPVSPSRT